MVYTWYIFTGATGVLVQSSTSFLLLLLLLIFFCCSAAFSLAVLLRCSCCLYRYAGLCHVGLYAVVRVCAMCPHSSNTWCGSNGRSIVENTKYTYKYSVNSRLVSHEATETTETDNNTFFIFLDLLKEMAKRQTNRLFFSATFDFRETYRKKRQKGQTTQKRGARYLYIYIRTDNLL